MSNDQIKSQILGAGLAIMTAIGCIAYEKLVKNLSCQMVVLLTGCSYVLFFPAAMLIDGQFKFEAVQLRTHWISVLVYFASGVTTLLWYLITRKQGVVVGSLYEIKYIVVMALIYILFGNDKLTWNTIIGIVLATLSVWFISRN